jgi:multisubunit Na+/H+ antiporter MnhF subunit
MNQVIEIAVMLALALHAALLGVALWRLVRGGSAADRLLGAELVSILILCIIIIVTMITGESMYIDVALGLAAVSFIGTLALAKYLADQRMF